MKVIIAMLSFVVLSGWIAGCSTISKEQCQVGDWNGIGEADGTKGKDKNAFYKYTEECAEYGVKPNHEQYKAGYAVGVKTYCTPQNGWEKGRSGARYYNVCPKTLSAAFLKNYNKGKKVWKLHNKIGQLKQKISQIDRNIETEENKLVSGGVTGAQVVAGGVKIDRMRREKIGYERQINTLQAKANRLESAFQVE